MPAAVAAVKAHADDEVNTSRSRVGRAVSRYYEVLLTLAPSHTAMTLDEQHLEGDYLMVEVLNTSSIGPNLMLSDAANPCDGFLSVVAIAEDDRHRLAEYIRCRPDRGECHAGFPARQARRIDVWGWNEMHIDGEVHRWSTQERVSIRAEAAAVQVLCSGPRFSYR